MVSLQGVHLTEQNGWGTRPTSGEVVLLGQNCAR